ncbi:hypothetical protein T484DRAFT_1805399, partial [Baffinella frigidus]
PKAFLIVSDASVVRHLLSESALKYDKGILAEILEPIMGQGLISGYEPLHAAHNQAVHALKYDKGILADILEPIMGQGLIPADLNTWQWRQRAVIPGFHNACLHQMTSMF